MNKPVIITSKTQFNAFGMRQAQLSLYQHMEKCSKEGKPISVEVVWGIYFTEVRNPEDYYLGAEHIRLSWRSHRNHTKAEKAIVKLKNKDAWEFINKHNDEFRFMSSDVSLVRQWMKANIGSLVMRGFLSAIPQLDTALLEN